MKKDNIELTEEIVRVLKTIFDPEIPVNVYDLGLIYEIEVANNNVVDIEMTLTAPNCPIADVIVANIKDAIEQIPEVEKVNIKLVFDPPWTTEMLTDEAKLELGML